ncbi:unnamed protein product [Durusdinium trenchii]|uniref:Uncharacterized protein n=2 Tax=Durusdinium trenchii TaxID=1381693 RepID=A0ABP0S598_9DINO
MDGEIPVFDVDLDEDPFVRWQEIARAYAPMLQKLADLQVALETPRAKKGRRRKATLEQRVARFAAKEALQLLERLEGAGGFMGEVLAELKGLAEAAQVPLQALCSLSLQYEAYCACTAVAARVEDGSIALARTLDWEFPQLKALNIDVRVFRGRQLLYVATTWAGYIGILTAQRPERYAAAVNFREPSETSEVKVDALPVGLALRSVLERNENYADFLKDIASIPVMAPFYCLVASTSGAAQITRDGLTEIKRRVLAEDQLYLVQANMDHWDNDMANDNQQSLERCKLVEEMLQLPLTRGYVEEDELWSILWKHPIYEKGITLYSTVMNPSQGTFKSLSDPPDAPADDRRGRKKSRK